MFSLNLLAFSGEVVEEEVSEVILRNPEAELARKKEILKGKGEYEDESKEPAEASSAPLPGCTEQVVRLSSVDVRT